MKVDETKAWKEWEERKLRNEGTSEMDSELTNPLIWQIVNLETSNGGSSCEAGCLPRFLTVMMQHFAYLNWKSRGMKC